MSFTVKLWQTCKMLRPSYVRNINHTLDLAASLQAEGHLTEALQLITNSLKENPESKALRSHYGTLQVLLESASRASPDAEKRDHSELR